MRSEPGFSQLSPDIHRVGHVGSPAHTTHLLDRLLLRGERGDDSATLLICFCLPPGETSSLSYRNKKQAEFFIVNNADPFVTEYWNKKLGHELSFVYELNHIWTAVWICCQHTGVCSYARTQKSKECLSVLSKNSEGHLLCVRTYPRPLLCYSQQTDTFLLHVFT